MTNNAMDCNAGALIESRDNGEPQEEVFWSGMDDGFEN